MKILPQNKAGWLRTLIPLALLGTAAGAALLYEPGAVVTDGRHDLGRNGAFMAHAWIASDDWFSASPERMKQMLVYRDTGQAIAKLDGLRQDGIQDLFPDLLPSAADGTLPKAGWNATEMFAYQAAARRQRVMPWVGGTRGVECFPDKPEWRKAFTASCADLLRKCPHLSGVLINLVPWPDGDDACLAMLDELRQTLPQGKRIAVVASPPAALLHRHKDAFWSDAYFRQVAGKCDLLVVRLHDSGITHGKLYRHMAATWSRDTLTLSGATPVLLSVADYEEATPSPVHLPAVENLANGLRAVHRALGAARQGTELPSNYAGVALFGDHTFTPQAWELWRKEFRKAPPPASAAKPAAPKAPAVPATPTPKAVPGPWKPEDPTPPQAPKKG